MAERGPIEHLGPSGHSLATGVEAHSATNAVGPARILFTYVSCFLFDLRHGSPRYMY